MIAAKRSTRTAALAKEALDEANAVALPEIILKEYNNMAEYLWKTWTKEALRKYFSGESSAAGIFPLGYDDGKAQCGAGSYWRISIFK